MLKEQVDVLIKSDYFGRRKSVSEFVEWVQNCLILASDISPSEAYYNNRMLKKVREEGFPISIFLQNSKKDIVEIEPSNNPDSNFDAKIFLKDKSILPLEVTCVMDGEFDLIRGALLEKNGIAPIKGVSKQQMLDVIKTDTECFGNATLVSDYIKSCAQGVHKRIEAKVSKKYPSNTILLVAIEDDFRSSTWTSIVSSISIGDQRTFSEIWLISRTSKSSAQLY